MAFGAGCEPQGGASSAAGQSWLASWTRPRPVRSAVGVVVSQVGSRCTAVPCALRGWSRCAARGRALGAPGCRSGALHRRFVRHSQAHVMARFSRWFIRFPLPPSVTRSAPRAPIGQGTSEADLREILDHLTRLTENRTGCRFCRALAYDVLRIAVPLMIMAPGAIIMPAYVVALPSIAPPLVLSWSPSTLPRTAARFPDESQACRRLLRPRGPRYPPRAGIWQARFPARWGHARRRGLSSQRYPHGKWPSRTFSDGARLFDSAWSARSRVRGRDPDPRRI